MNRLALLAAPAVLLLTGCGGSSTDTAIVSSTADVCTPAPDARCDGADLAGVDLSGRDLTGIDMRGANLVDADLSGANLTQANLVGANLAGANLSRAALVRTALDTADLSGANFTRSRLTGATLRRSNLTGASFSATFATDANFSGATLDVRGDGEIDGFDGGRGAIAGGEVGRAQDIHGAHPSPWRRFARLRRIKVK